MSPSEVETHGATLVPPQVFDVFNELIAENMSGGSATVKQDEAVRRILAKMPENTSRDQVFRLGWLNVEPHYRKAGWRVEYDKPGYNESYDAFFVFSRKR